MSQIYNGSFVLGNTSATQISAGPGIKLDTSVPGVIGISNDETILYSGATGTSAVNLNESMTNFERLKIALGNDHGGDGITYYEFPAQPNRIVNMHYCAGGGSNAYLVFLFASATNTSITITNEVAIQKPFNNTTINGQTKNQGYINAIHSVIGVNRKQNGGV